MATSTDWSVRVSTRARPENPSASTSSPTRTSSGSRWAGSSGGGDPGASRSSVAAKLVRAVRRASAWPVRAARRASWSAWRAPRSSPRASRRASRRSVSRSLSSSSICLSNSRRERSAALRACALAVRSRSAAARSLCASTMARSRSSAPFDIRARASSTIAASMPSRSAISRALLDPGMPSRRR